MEESRINHINWERLQRERYRVPTIDSSTSHEHESQEGRKKRRSFPKSLKKFTGKWRMAISAFSSQHFLYTILPSLRIPSGSSTALIGTKGGLDDSGNLISCGFHFWDKKMKQWTWYLPTYWKVGGKSYRYLLIQAWRLEICQWISKDRHTECDCPYLRIIYRYL